MSPSIVWLIQRRARQLGAKTTQFCSLTAVGYPAEELSPRVQMAVLRYGSLVRLNGHIAPPLETSTVSRRLEFAEHLFLED
jgi:hypothetical protein